MVTVRVLLNVWEGDVFQVSWLWLSHELIEELYANYFIEYHSSVFLEDVSEMINLQNSSAEKCLKKRSPSSPFVIHILYFKFKPWNQQLRH